MKLTLPNFGRLLVVILLFYLTTVLVLQYVFNFKGVNIVITMFDAINFFIHEAGHLLFLPFNIFEQQEGFGRFLYISSGSFFQWLIPLLFIRYFFITEQFFSASVVLFWFGESLLYSSPYIISAKTNGPILDTGLYHDWYYLFNTLHLLNYSELLGTIVKILAFIIIVICLILSTYICYISFRTNYFDPDEYI